MSPTFLGSRLDEVRSVGVSGRSFCIILGVRHGRPQSRTVFCSVLQHAMRSGRGGRSQVGVDLGNRLGVYWICALLMTVLVSPKFVWYQTLWLFG